jgi:hypothetical protein
MGFESALRSSVERQNRWHTQNLTLDCELKKTTNKNNK